MAGELDLRSYFGIKPAEARVLAVLDRAEGAAVAVQDLARMASVTERSVRVHICKLRYALDPEAIDTFVSASQPSRCIRSITSYALTEIGRKDCRMAEQVAA